jgi:hypothetical protein
MRRFSLVPLLRLLHASHWHRKQIGKNYEINIAMPHAITDSQIWVSTGLVVLLGASL